MKIRRFKTLLSLPGVFNSDIEFIEYSTKKGVFYRKGYPNKDKIGLDFEIHNKIFKIRGFDKWYEPLSYVSIRDTDEYKIIYEDLKNSIALLDREINTTSVTLNNLIKRRKDLLSIVGDD